jgi:SpoVK/Ycf46/Vps4 family AAA+-type ATPase
VIDNNHRSEDRDIAHVAQVSGPEPQPPASRAPRVRPKPKQGGGGTTPVATEEERELDYSLRPRSLAEFVGQRRLKQVLGMSIEAARQRGEALDHTLFSAPPGLGKTSLAHIIARELGVNLRVTAGPAIERAGDLAAIVSDLAPGDVLFIDEIHRLARVVEEILYPAMEDFELNLVVGKGPGARTMKLAVKPFTLVGATTRSGLLRPRCATASASTTTWIFIVMMNWPRSFSVRPSCSQCVLIRRGRPNWRLVPAARHGLPIDCCGGCAILPK